MTPSLTSPLRLKLKHTLAAALCALALASHAAPGAHGPDGEHLDAPAGAAVAGVAALPRFEAQSELFEVVGRLQADGLSLYLNQFQSSEPVLQAQLQIESGALQGTAAFRPEQGDYLLNDAALLQALRQPGQHALVLTVIAGEQSDLLEGTLQVAAPVQGGHGHEHTLLEELALPLALAGGGLLLAGGGIWFLRRSKAVRAGKGL
ncbi:MAG: hypothetical protein Q7T22_06320 [Serpentinimonas sp.]|nr:MAG: hypothetical protein JM57_08690 [Comamonadaceae bacterium BICA1-1]MDO8275119.1 hypothetical protein [Serpentinimonas sp.]